MRSSQARVAKEDVRPTRTVCLPFIPVPAEWALIQAPLRMSEAEWASMIDVLALMKIGFVEPVLVSPKRDYSHVRGDQP